MGNPTFRFTLSRQKPQSLRQVYPLSEWVNEGVPLTTSWVTGEFPSLTLPNGGTSDRLRRTGISGIPAGDYVLKYSITSTKQNFLTARIRFEKANAEVSQMYPDTHGANPIEIPLIVGTKTGTVNINLSDVPDEVNIMVFDAGSTGSSDIVVHYLDLVMPSQTNSMVISEPDGWKDAILKMERHPEFHSLIEYFEGSFIFYGENNIDNGGADFIKTAEQQDGASANIQVLIEADIDGDGFYEEMIFTGQLDLTGLKEVDDNKIQVPIIRTDLWAKFIARKEVPINLRSTKDLDRNVIPETEIVDINLVSQKIKRRYVGRYQYAYEVGQLENSGFEYYQPDFEREDFDEIEGKITLPRLMSNTVMPIFDMEEDGVYAFNVKLTLGHNAPIDPNFSQSTLGKYIPYFQINDNAPVPFSGVDVTHGADVVTEWTYNNVHALNRLDTVKIYVRDEFDFSTDVLYIFGDEGFEVSGSFRYGESYMTVEAATTFPNSTAQGFLIHDAAAAIVDRMIGTPDRFRSEYIGSTQTIAHQYDSDGCAWKNIILQGLQLRGYDIGEKQFSMSFDKFWKCIQPLLFLGLSYEDYEDVESIVIRELSYYFTPDVSVRLSNVRQISRVYDSALLYNQIEAGFNKWQSEDISGIDDVQTKRVWSFVPSKHDRPLKVISEAVLASNTIEVTRRKRKEKTEDYKYDNDTFIIAINGNGVSPDRYLPELDENFDSITGLSNSDTRYNTIHTPLRMLLRWAKWWNGCLQKYQNSVVEFASGEGNYDMVSKYNCNSGDPCLAVICDAVSEKADLNLATYGQNLGYLHLPLLYTIEVINFTWDQYVAIRNNRHLAIGISQTLDSYKRFFIKELSYEICKGKAKIVAWPYDETAIEVIDNSPQPEPEESGFAPGYQAILNYATATCE